MLCHNAPHAPLPQSITVSLRTPTNIGKLSRKTAIIYSKSPTFLSVRIIGLCSAHASTCYPQRRPLVRGRMSLNTWDEDIQGTGCNFLIENGIAVHDFEDYTFRAPRPGFFLGDSLTPDGDVNPVTRFEQLNSSENIPPCQLSGPLLGRLDRLPTELLCEVFLSLDVCSLLEFRRVNQQAKTIVDEYPPFRYIFTFPKLLGAVEALQYRSYTIDALLHCVFDERCSSCGHFEDLIYLVTPERLCYRCWLQDSSLVVQRIKPNMMRRIEILADWKLIPSMRFSCGLYGQWAHYNVSDQVLGLDVRALRRALPEACNWLGQVERGHSLRYTTVIRAPYWDASSARFEEGFFCKACASQGWTYRSHDRLSLFVCEKYPIWDVPWSRHTRDGMRAHIIEHGPIFKVRTTGEEERFVHEKPFTRYTWDEPTELREISHVLRRCREESLQFPQGLPFLSTWDRVSPTVERR